MRRPAGLNLRCFYGRRKIRAWLQHSGFPEISKHTVDRLMREAGMKGLVRGRKTITTIHAKDKIRAKNLLNRNFHTDAPDKVWITRFHLCADRCRIHLRIVRDRLVLQADPVLGDADLA